MSINNELVAKQVFNTIQNLIATGTPEKFIFRRYRGDKLAKALSSGQKLEEGDGIDTVILRVNPAQVSFDKKKIITKVQTSSPGRFVVYDWGTDLTVLSIQGNTGMLLPDSIVNGGNPLTTFFNDVASQADFIPGNMELRNEAQAINSVGTGIATPFINNIMMSTMTYMELLNMSPKYRVFKKLENMFELSDADRDILILEFGDYGIFRGYFESFTFDMVAETPWNWKYNIIFIILADLNKAVKRQDDQYMDSDFLS